MEIYQLKSFITIAREKNLTRSAELLHLSQSALSSQIKALEANLGVQLFNRSSRGMQLSEQGQSLLRYAEDVLESAGRLGHEALLLKRGAGSSMTIGLNADPSFLRVSAINQRLVSLYADVSAIFLTCQSVNTAQMLRRGMIDLGIFYGQLPDNDIAGSILAHIRFCLVIPSSLSQPGRLMEWADIASLPWIWVGNDCPPYRLPQEQFDALKLTPNQSTLAVDEQIVRELVMAGQGVAMMRADEAESLVKSGQVVIWDKGWHTLPLSLGWLKERTDEKMITSTRDVIHHVWLNKDEYIADQLSDKYWA